MSTLFVDTINEKTSGNGVEIPGHVLQAKTATKTDTQSTSTNNTFVDITGLSVSITPSSTSSKILVLCSICLSTSFYWNVVRILRDSTQINPPDAAGSNRVLVNGVQTDPTAVTYTLQTIPISILDSPSSTSALTYKAQFNLLGSSSYASYVNYTGRDYDNALGYDPRASSSITVLEIGG